MPQDGVRCCDMEREVRQREARQIAQALKIQGAPKKLKAHGLGFGAVYLGLRHRADKFQSAIDTRLQLS